MSVTKPVAFGGEFGGRHHAHAGGVVIHALDERICAVRGPRLPHDLTAVLSPFLSVGHSSHLL